MHQWCNAALVQRFTASVSDEVGDGLRLEAARRRLSVSALLAELAEGALAGRDDKQRETEIQMGVAPALGTEAAMPTQPTPSPRSSVSRPASVPEPAVQPLRNAPRVNAPSEFKPDPKPGRKP